ncbi:MAG: hypothetical protein ACLRSW_03150 [Christensenellaceae bacterium]
MGVSLIAPFIGGDTPVTVIQMLWINIIMDTLAGWRWRGTRLKGIYGGTADKARRTRTQQAYDPSDRLRGRLRHRDLPHFSQGAPCSNGFFDTTKARSASIPPFLRCLYSRGYSMRSMPARSVSISFRI